MKGAVEELFKYRGKFIIIGLTGRTGSGCSTVASILSKSKENILYSESLNSDFTPNEQRKHKHLMELFQKKWEKFFPLSLRDILTTFILECSFEEIECLVKDVCNVTSLQELREEFEECKRKAKCLEPIYKYSPDDANEDDVYKFLNDNIRDFTSKFKTTLDKHSINSFVTLYQAVGNNVRSHGDALSRKEIMFDHVFSISDRTNQIIKCLRRYNEKHNFPDYFVIDAFRNPIEVKFFQERYTAFYLWAIHCPESERVERLIAKDLQRSQIKEIDDREYPKKSMLSSHGRFISQSIKECLQIADVHITNAKEDNPAILLRLADQIIKYVLLIIHPGIVTPSRDERCMQIAFAAKLNSGCISRQVGAAVVDDKGFIRSVGWNDAPQGQSPCILRTATDLLSNNDKEAFSEYELSQEFMARVAKYKDKICRDFDDTGLPLCFCFKDLYTENNQVHTRALHAEENAFLALIGHAGSLIRGGTLYSTASPCVLCAKKTSQLGIARVVFIDTYPDIAISHILKSAKPSVQVSLFSGAVGTAYFRLYLPIVSYKDELIAFSNC